jgi:hypothetical protein
MGHYRHVSCDGIKENLQIHYSPYPLMYFNKPVSTLECISTFIQRLYQTQ